MSGHDLPQHQIELYQVATGDRVTSTAITDIFSGQQVRLAKFF